MEKISSFILATRPKTLPASLGPLAVATSLAYSVTGRIDLLILLSALITFLSLQIAVNLFNDVLDFKKGADTKDRLGPKRVTQAGIFTPLQVTLFGTLFLTLAFISSVPMIAKGGMPIACVTILAACAVYIYSGGPYPLAYHGLGEPFVFIFYGLAAVLSLYFIETKTIDLSALLAALQIGLYVTAIIGVANIRDVKEDALTGKKTIAVRIGENSFKHVIAFLNLSPYFFGALWILFKPLSFFLPLLLLPFAIDFVRTIYKTPPSRAYIAFLAKCALLQLTFATLLSLSFIL